MISDEELKKAVKFLRERKCLKLDCHECHQMSEMLLGDLGALCAIDEQWGALADLIERPTCSMEYRPEWSGDELYPTSVYECSVCGHVVQEGKPDYCPGCGAEVVPHA